MPELPVLLIVLAVIAVVAVMVMRRGGPRTPLTAAFSTVADRHGWRRITAADAAEILQPFDRYLSDGGTVDVAVGGDEPEGHVMVAAVGTRDKVAIGRPWYVATVSRPDLATPEITLEPRSVRTVRVVAGEDEVVIDDARISRGWRITSADPRAAEVLDQATSHTGLSDALHRPMPFIVGLRTRPGAIAVHLAGPEDEPGDADDLDRLTRLAREVADALAAVPA